MAFLFIVLMLCGTVTASAKETAVEHARPSVNGALKVVSSDLVDKNNSPVILGGVSLHGITWFPGFVNEDMFMQVSKDWNANLIRIPVYPEEYLRDKEECMELVRKGIDAAVAADMYVIVDWHVLEEQNPNIHINESHEFFKAIASKYSSCPNMIYEICNEPNGETTWADVREYAYSTIPVIRELDPDALILVGTPNYCKNLIAAVRNPIKHDNIMYTMHFYAGTHKEDLRREYSMAVEAGLPVFVSECGLSEASGSENIDYESAASWFSLLEEKNTSFCVWSLSNKNESSAMFSPFYDPAKGFTDIDLTGCGQWVSKLLMQNDPRNIPIPETGRGASWYSSLMRRLLEKENTEVATAWPEMALASLAIVILFAITTGIVTALTKKRHPVYDDLYKKEALTDRKERMRSNVRIAVIMLSAFFTLLYLGWRIAFSIPKGFGPLAVAGNIILLVVEVIGFIESVILYGNLCGLRDHKLPVIADDEYPDVDIFIATYNEPVDLLEKTINGCNHLKYPDRNKVHIWLCDDNRREQMRELADRMHIGYFDRPNNEGAKAGNLNHALSLTKAPYVVTLDADMIPKSDFLISTIPYFVDAKKRSVRLGLLQTPQCFYTPDVFQYALYSEKNAPNEQDFFYRTIEVAKTSTNSVIYGGSNTVIAREALDKIGGFFTGSITEDFATGMLIESEGFVSLALPNPLASGMTPHTYKEHIQQRKRWGRGVISTAKQLHLFGRKGLSFSQKVSYLSSVIYWFSPVKNLIYILSPLMFAVFAIPVFRCGWLDLVMYWFPMFILQDVALRVASKNAVSLKWSGIYETSVMPHLLIPTIKETFGISASVFEVTDKSKHNEKRRTDMHMMMPFIILTALCVIGIIRSLYLLAMMRALGIVVLLFWLVRNTYFLVMSMFLVDGRDGEADEVTVIDAESVTMTLPEKGGIVREGITTYMTGHNIKVFMDESDGLAIGDRADVSFESDGKTITLECVITSVTYSRHGESCVLGCEILSFNDDRYEYMQLLYDRVPTLPQSLVKDYGIIYHMLRNVAFRILRL